MYTVLKTDAVKKVICDQIDRMALKPGDIIYSENQMIDICAVSRVTVRRAVKQLVNEGLLFSVRGKGVFVTGGRRSARRDSSSDDRLKLIEYIAPMGEEISNKPVYGAIQVMLATEREIARRGYKIVFTSTGGNVDEERRKVKAAVDGRYAGIMLEPVCNETNDSLLGNLELLRKSGRPYVILDHYVPDDKASNVYEDDFHGAYIAVSHLIGQGHRRILHINSDCDYLSVRRKGYKTALIDHGISIEDSLNFHGPSRMEGGKYHIEYKKLGYQAVVECLRRKTGFTAIFAVNDAAAAGAIDALRDKGLEVPSDISVVGYDDCAYEEYALTTIRRPFDEIGIIAAQSLMDQMHSGAARTPVGMQVGVKPTLVIRDSVSPPHN
ncbi:MAG: GntR family transcriptional regulator [Victivallales bacterium]